ncbi:hypothetical protein DOT_4771 [Desulfosporosinus sp. OT]|nr:hypothetical protein DOT_4771 [Desulfosporosinus sp. OT]
MYERYGEIKLTDQGKEFGHYLVTRNQLLQEFLALICSKCDLLRQKRWNITFHSNDLCYFNSCEVYERLSHLVASLYRFYGFKRQAELSMNKDIVANEFITSFLYTG